MKKLLIFLFILITYSCNKINFKESAIPLDFTLPLANFSIKDSLLFKWANIEDKLQKDPDGILQIVSSTSFNMSNSPDFKSIFTLSDQSFNSKKELNLGIITGDKVINMPSNISFDYKIENLNKDAKIEEMALESGLIILNVINQTSDFSDVTYTIPQLTKNNIPLQIKNNQSASLAGYILKTTGNDNKLEFIVKGSIKAKSGDNLNSVTFNGRIENLKFSSFLGFFGRKEIELSNEYGAKLDNEISSFMKDAGIYASNPQFCLNINNEYNVPILITIKSFSINNDIIYLKQGLNTSKFLLKAKQVSPIMFTNKSTINQNEIPQAMAKGLEKYKFTFSIILNPTKEDLGENLYQMPTINSISNKQSLNTENKIIVPLSGKFKSIKSEQLINFDLSSSSDGDKNTNDKINYKNIKLAILAENQLPIGVKINIRAYSKDGDSLDIFSKPIAIPASNNLKPNNSTFKPGEINKDNVEINTLDEKTSKMLMNSKKIRLILDGQSSNYPNQDVNIYSPSSLRIKLISNLKGEIKL